VQGRPRPRAFQDGAPGVSATGGKASRYLRRAARAGFGPGIKDAALLYAAGKSDGVTAHGPRVAISLLLGYVGSGRRIEDDGKFILLLWRLLSYEGRNSDALYVRGLEVASSDAFHLSPGPRAESWRHGPLDLGSDALHLSSSA
jgi:hypothetical protein